MLYRDLKRRMLNAFTIILTVIKIGLCSWVSVLKGSQLERWLHKSVVGFVPKL